MKKYTLITALLLSVIYLTACSSIPGGKSEPSAENETAVSETTTAPNVIEEADEADVPAASIPNPKTLEILDNEEWKSIYKNFLTESYETLKEACIGGIAGIGFIDLDLDGAGEMLIFDFGASAAMGVQIFDIVDGHVECVSANMEFVRDKFAGDHFSSQYVNTGLFESFRLMEDNKTDKRFFMVESGNGATDFNYQEWIYFGNEDDVVTLTSKLYKHEDFDEDGEVVAAVCAQGDVSVSLDRFEEELVILQGASTDTQYEAKGTFIWEDESYYEEFNGFMDMVDNSLEIYAQTNLG